MDNPAEKTSSDLHTLTYEETPIIHPVGDHSVENVAASDVPEPEDPSSVVPEAAQVFRSEPAVELSQPVPNSHPTVSAAPAAHGSKPPKKFHMGTVLFILLLFGLGVWLSSQLRSFFAPVVSQETVIPTLFPQDSIAPSRAPSASGSAVQPVSGWTTYSVISGATKKPIGGLSYQLPSSVAAPVCDSASCASQGTNLPGGTRFTVAVRGKGQLLPDFRGAILTDAAGREFTMKQTMIGTQYVYEYMGDFTGRTGGGYTFTKMRGVLVPISEILGVEFNHFAPISATTDFAADEKVFDDIIKSFIGNAPASTVSPTVKPTVSLPASTPIATSTGF